MSNLPLDQSLYDFEFSINIIFRSCILDSLLMSAWVKDKSRGMRLIRDLVVSSYLLAPIGASKNIKLELAAGANYYNLGCKRAITKARKAKILEHTASEGIFVYLKGANNIKSFRTAYDMYSKFDHFSAIPYFHYLGRPKIEKMEIHLSSLSLIKHALAQMLLKKKDVLAENFCDLLDFGKIK